MEYCSGGDLYERMPYTEAQAANITHQITSAVSGIYFKNDPASLCLLEKEKDQKVFI
jgi:serine/threonine protein kinase